LGGYGSYGGVGNFGKQPIDIGGVVLGALIGIGAVLIVPKIAYIFSGHLGGIPGTSGGYYRSELKKDNSLNTTGSSFYFYRYTRSWNF
jgi:hypothetical protein